jgi:glycosyltransferase involved in cell wall biosynthesis
MPARTPSVFWYSNHPDMPTGYGTQSAQVLRRLKRRGHDVAIHANYGGPAAMSKWRGLQVFPAGHDGYSMDVIYGHWSSWADDSSILATLFDVWVLRNPNLERVERIVSWTPVDHSGLPAEVYQWVSKPNVTPIAMSKHGQRAMADRDVESVYIPHALEKHWKPTPMVGPDPWPGRFVVMIPNANKGVLPSRKAWGENVLAFAVFAKRHPEALLYLHTEIRSTAGIDLVALLEAAGVSKQQVVFVDQYEHRLGVPDDVMARLYSRADVLLSATAGEGFGLPVLEAQACGTRVIVSNCSAQPELVGDGWVCEVQPQWNPTQGQWFATPFVHSIVEALEAAFASGGAYSDDAVTFAADYHADKVFEERWIPLLELFA